MRDQHPRQPVNVEPPEADGEQRLADHPGAPPDRHDTENGDDDRQQEGGAEKADHRAASPEPPPGERAGERDGEGDGDQRRKERLQCGETQRPPVRRGEPGPRLGRDREHRDRADGEREHQRERRPTADRDGGMEADAARAHLLSASSHSASAASRADFASDTG